MPLNKHTLSNPSTPVPRKKARTYMPLSDDHPKLRDLSTKDKRRKECNMLISAIVRSLAAKKPAVRSTCSNGHDVHGPVLNTGVENLANAGEWFVICNTCPRRKRVVSPPIGELVLMAHPDYKSLKVCKEELAKTPRKTGSGVSSPATSILSPAGSLSTARSFTQMPSSPATAPPMSSSPVMDPQSSPPPGLHLERTSAVRTDKGEAYVTIRAYLQNNRPAQQIIARVDPGLRLRLSQHKVSLGLIGLDLGVVGVEVYFKKRWMAIRSDTSFGVQHGGIVCLRVAGVDQLDGWSIDSQFL
ncbi:hypothetical protein HWV62_16154 [Athelia sp. TMB]|nr:hypothetical protein HWV62_16154 [Athelia sp. TMB]